MRSGLQRVIREGKQVMEKEGQVNIGSMRRGEQQDYIQNMKGRSG